MHRDLLFWIFYDQYLNFILKFLAIFWWICCFYCIGAFNKQHCKYVRYHKYLGVRQGGVSIDVGIYLFTFLSITPPASVYIYRADTIVVGYTIRSVLLLLAISEFVNLVLLSLTHSFSSLSFFFICRFSTHSFLLALSLFALFK